MTYSETLRAMVEGPAFRPVERLEGATALRFWRYVDRSDRDGCWPWLGMKDRDGYGRFRLGSRKDGSRVQLLAHRLAYVFFYGPEELPDCLTLDHICDRRDCMNPRHMRPATIWANTRRGKSVSSVNARKQCCRNGHPFTEGNTRYRPDGSRACRACNRLRMERRRVNRTLAAGPP